MRDYIVYVHNIAFGLSERLIFFPVGMNVNCKIFRMLFIGFRKKFLNPIDIVMFSL